jgi:hypothetical protein
MSAVLKTFSDPKPAVQLLREAINGFFGSSFRNLL